VEVVSKDAALRLLAAHREQLLGAGQRCVMCALAGGGSGLPFIAESRHGVVLLDRFACRYGHLMIIPRAHFERASELSWELFVDVQRLCFDAQRALDRWASPARVFTASLGAAAELPMTYSHYHLHVIPVVDTDERARPARVLSWSEGVVVYADDEAERISHELRAAWPGRD